MTPGQGHETREQLEIGVSRHRVTRSSCARYRKRQTLRGSRLCRRRVFLEKLESRYMLSALGVIDPAGNNINGSTFGSGSFAITNTSQIGQQIDRIELVGATLT